MRSLGVSPVKILQGVTQTHFYTIFMDGMLLFAHTLMLFTCHLMDIDISGEKCGWSKQKMITKFY